MNAYRNNDGSFQEDASRQAASLCDLTALHYLNENGCPWDKFTFMIAVSSGHLKCIKFLLNNGCPIYEDACNLACQWGYFNILKYLHEHCKCSINENTMYYVDLNSYASEERLSIIKYLIEHNCPMYKQHFEMCENLFRYERWFQNYVYMNQGIINEYTLHIHHKILRIQQAWITYSYDPSTPVGYKRMMNSFKECNNMLKTIVV